MSSARRRCPARAAGVLAALVLLAAGCGSSNHPQPAAAAQPRPRVVARTTTTTTTTTIPPLPNLDPATGLGVSGPIGPPWPSQFIVADARVPAVALYQAPGIPVPTHRTLPNPTVEHVPLVMLVRATFGSWLQVKINARPNGATAWIKSSDVALRTVPNHILISLGAKRLVVFHGAHVIWSTSVAPGKASSPTPIGSFYVDVLAKPTDPNGPYGAYQISFTGFSTVYESFDGGIGQVAMHGTNEPALIGTPASHGCVRLSNADITYLLPMATQGTPVDVVA